MLDFIVILVKECSAPILIRVRFLLNLTYQVNSVIDKVKTGAFFANSGTDRRVERISTEGNFASAFQKLFRQI